MTQSIGKCKFCGEEKELCKSHIIPRGFYSNYKTKKYIEVDSKTFSKTRSSVQSGVWDKTILCPECEGIINEFEKEGYKILRDNLINHRVFLPDQKIIYSYKDNDFDYQNLRCFFISMIWRASISTKYKDIQLGKYENKALEVLKKYNEHKELFKIIVFREPDGMEFNNLVFLMKSQISRRICFRLFFSQFQICILPTIQNMPTKDNLLLRNLYLEESRFMIIEDPSTYDSKLKIIYKARNRL